MALFRKKFALYFFALSAFLLRASFISAVTLEVKYPDFLGKSLNNNSTIGDFVCYLFNAGLILAITIAVTTIVVGGIYYLISYGQGKFTDEGKAWVKAGILGLLIIVCSSLILYTINPNIGSCKIDFLPQLNLNPFSSNDTAVPPGVIVATYNEIPIGILTENLLTRTSVCTDFDKYGDYATPSPFEETGSNRQPTSKDFVNQDRVACLRQFVEGMQKKANVAALLGAEITKLMDTCSCANPDGSSKCSPVCDPANGGCQLQQNGSCGGSCVGGACKQPPDTKDCCPSVALSGGQPLKDLKTGQPLKESNGDPWSVKDQIEHGPIYVHVNCKQDTSGATPSDKDVNGKPCEQVCNTDGDCKATATFSVAGGGSKIIKVEGCDLSTHTCARRYNGLDEFRCPNTTPEPGQQAGEDRVPLATNASQSADEQCSNIKKIVAPNGQDYGAQGVMVIDPIKWRGINLWQQIKFYSEILPMWAQGQGFKEDADNLQAARAQLAKCYLAMPYADLISAYKVAPQKDRVVLRQTSAYQDFTTGQAVNASQYCTGFNYNNSTCLKHCNDDCPDTGDGAIQAYGDCDSGSTSGGSGDQVASCVQNAYKTRPCTKGTGDSATFSECITACQSSLKEVCARNYPSCSPEYNNCYQWAGDNGQCVLNNLGKCLFDTQGAKNFANCAKLDSTDKGNINFCINNAYSCKNGSDEFAGYKDCVNTPLSLNCASYNNSLQCSSANGIGNGLWGGCVWNPDICVNKSSSAVCNKAKNQASCTGSCEWKQAQCAGAAACTGLDQTSCTNDTTDQCAWQPANCTVSSTCATFGDPSSCNGSSKCKWQTGTCSQDYSASFLWQKKSVQKCTASGVPATSGKCTSSSNPDATCQEVCPETSKCPTASDCAACPCDKIDKPITFYVPDRSTAISKKDCSSNADCPINQNSTQPSTPGQPSATSQSIAGELCSTDSPSTAAPGATSVPTGSAPANGLNACTITGARCQTDDECFQDQVCVENICMSSGKNAIPCTDDSDCVEEGETCSPTKNVCVTNAGNEKSGTETPNIAIYQMVGPQCNTYSYNDDPLTFYCQDNWWADPQKEGTANPATPVGKEKTCDKGGDIPIGQTVDNALAWANNVFANVELMAKDAQLVLDQMTKIGKAKDTEPVKNYCTCSAQYGNGEPICNTDCKYSQSQSQVPICAPAPPDTPDTPPTTPSDPGCIPNNYQNCVPAGSIYWGNLYWFDSCGNQGSYIAPCIPSPFNWNLPTYNPAPTFPYNNSSKNITASLLGTSANNKIISDIQHFDINNHNPFVLAENGCPPGQVQTGTEQAELGSCDLVPCKGSPCQQVVDYNSQLWNAYKKLKTDYMSFDVNIIKEPRSDILKQLTYSRQQANTCSVNNTIVGGADTRLLSCSRAEDELLPPINQDKLNFGGKDYTGYCYGKNLGNAAGKDLTDDWMCCHEWNDKQVENNNPIYNIKNKNY